MNKYALLMLACVLTACGSQPKQNEELAEGRQQSLLHLADSMQRNGDIYGAIDLYERAMNQSTKLVDAHLALANLYSLQEKPEKARDVLLKAKKRQPKHAMVNLGLAKLAVREEKVEEALKHFDAGLDGTPNDLDLLNGKAVALDMLGRHAEAQGLYYQALRKHHKDTEFIQNNLAMSYIMNGDYDEAIAELKAADALDESAVMRQNLALAYGLKGEMGNARKWGLKDLTQKEFNENLQFYKEYTQELRDRQKLD